MLGAHTRFQKCISAHVPSWGGSRGRSACSWKVQKRIHWPRGPMDKASAYGAGDCRFESCRGHMARIAGQLKFPIASPGAQWLMCDLCLAKINESKFTVCCESIQNPRAFAFRVSRNSFMIFRRLTQGWGSTAILWFFWFSLLSLLALLIASETFLPASAPEYFCIA